VKTIKLITLSNAETMLSLSSGSASRWVVRRRTTERMPLQGRTESVKGARDVSNRFCIGYAAGVLAAISLPSTSSAQWTLTNLHPESATGSYAWGTSESRQVGHVEMCGTNHASIWSGSATAWLDIHPPGAIESFAFGISGDQQSGYALVDSSGDLDFGYHACRWTGTGASWVDLNPARKLGRWNESFAFDASGSGRGARRGRRA